VDGSYKSEQLKYEAAIAELEKVREQHGSARTSVLATYFIGECNRRLGNHEDAIESFKSYLTKEGPGGELSIFAVEGIGVSLEASGQVDEARKRYRQLTQSPFDRQPDRGLYHLARLEQKAGNLEAAARQFGTIIEKHPDTPFRQAIEDRLDHLPKVAVAGGDSGQPDEPGEKTEKPAEPEPESKPEPTGKDTAPEGAAKPAAAKPAEPAAEPAKPASDPGKGSE
jgi:tetratricopeptide (TPR) repeat protein